MNLTDLLRRNWVLLLGLLSLAIPTISELATTLWNKTDQEHGPIVLALVAWIFWRELPAFLPLPNKPVKWGWLLIIPALLAYVLGRSQEIWLLEVGAFIPLLAGITLLHKGWAGLKAMRAPLLFLLFVIPLPGFLVDALTNGLKQNISLIAENLLYGLGYPVARSGVTLTVGQYQLLVADACSGINSLFSLFALGFVYLYLQAYASKVRNLLLLLAIAPVAILANIIRVMVLVLVTYYFGDEAGQGFVHGAAGILVFIIALLALFIWDWLLGLFFDYKQKRRTA
ncbi:exosortase B [Aeromonas allosaccharophila]